MFVVVGGVNYLILPVEGDFHSVGEFHFAQAAVDLELLYGCLRIVAFDVGFDFRGECRVGYRAVVRRFYLDDIAVFGELKLGAIGKRNVVGSAECFAVGCRVGYAGLAVVCREEGASLSRELLSGYVTVAGKGKTRRSYCQRGADGKNR